MRTKLSPDELRILAAAAKLGPTRIDGSIKCDKILRLALESQGQIDSALKDHLFADYTKNRAVKRLYNLLRSLVKRGFLKGKGNLRWGPADPPYTEAAITPLGQATLDRNPSMEKIKTTPSRSFNRAPKPQSGRGRAS